MSGPSGPTDTTIESLRARVDEFATQLALQGVTDELAEELAAFCEEALKTINATAASELSNILSKPLGQEREELVAGEIIKLQELLDASSVESQQIRTEEECQKGNSEPHIAQLAQDTELVKDFIVEARDHLTSIESQMLILEQNTSDVAAVHTVFRGFHTIKGLAGFLEFQDIQCVAHQVETLLDSVRNGKLTITPAVVDVVLSGADYLREAIACIEQAMSDNSCRVIVDYDQLLSRIRNAMNGTDQATAEINVAPQAGAPSSKEMQRSPSADSQSQPAKGTPKPKKALEQFSIRVDTGKLDHLMDMVGEMVIAQSLIHHNGTLTSLQDARLQRDLCQLARITNDVQRTTMSMRMLPIGQLFQRTARLARDLSRRAGKQVELTIEGEDTEVDKTIAEELSDPLMHMIRNALDHGIEVPDERVAAGKQPTAHIRLAAFHQGGQIVVEIQDDGRGLNCKKIIEKAKANGLIQEDQFLTEAETFHLIFEPGFSTADQVTDISGRGVGMDVVRGSIQKLRGRIDVHSEKGRGTTFCLRLPLTLAIIDGLIVVVGEHRYIVPLHSVKEMFRPTAEMVSTVEGRHEMATVRGRLLPIVRLHRRFNLKPKNEELKDGLLVVSECQGRQFCLFVDDLVGKQEVVIKSLGGTLKSTPGIAGGAILGDGRVGLILDMDGVFPGTHHE